MSTDLEDTIRGTLHAVADATPVGRVPIAGRGSMSRPRRRSIVMISAGVATVALVGAGTAGAAVLWSRNGARYDDIPGDHVVSSRVFSEPGPKGTGFRMWVGATAKGYTCLATYLTGTAADPALRQLAPSDGGRECLHHYPAVTTSFGEQGSNGPTPSPYFLYTFSSGSAVTATLTLPNGDVLPTVVGDGWIGGWVASRGAHGEATLAGYDSAGDKVGSVRFSLHTGDIQPTVTSTTTSQP